MKKIVYYVATSLDGYIAGENGDISQFLMQGKGVDKYQADLLNFGTVIMGRKTYEFGYQYGLIPGQPAYPHMKHHIFSTTLKIDKLSEMVKIERGGLDRINEIQQNTETDIYLCGGGQFAGYLLDHGKIDQLKIKLNPIVLGKGTKLFGSSTSNANWELIDNESYAEGLQILTYNRR
ncbi:MAG: dihydrofolate reductase [Cytophagales bacterium]|uniref:dihydrofolate reductase family protein n=1 Tax=Cyclobacterium marinum TaxID=104 RepID=UPI0030D858EB|nr:dihydrofolate reductase [Cytophagales bacterium]|tara:strand:+ start:14481 stop:15011 length:531 start_codon:yes stop_codon:yes gene_type:complete